MTSSEVNASLSHGYSIEDDSGTISQHAWAWSENCSLLLCTTTSPSGRRATQKNYVEFIARA